MKTNLLILIFLHRPNEIEYTYAQFSASVTERGKCEHESLLCEALKIFIARGPNFHQI